MYYCTVYLRLNMVIRCEGVTGVLVAVCGQVGHTAAVLVARYSPRMFRIDGTLKACLALGSQVCPNRASNNMCSLTATCIMIGISTAYFKMFRPGLFGCMLLHLGKQSVTANMRHVQSIDPASYPKPSR